MTNTSSRRLPRLLSHPDDGFAPLSDDYFRPRDFEYVQPLYDLAFFLEVNALARGAEVPKYRTFSLWRAAYSLDGYGTTLDRWLSGLMGDEDLDYVPSSRIREYLKAIRRSGTVPELRSYRTERFERCLRLRSVRGLGPNKIALTLSSRSLAEDWFSEIAMNLSLDRDRITKAYDKGGGGPWQAAHVVPPLLRFLHAVELCYGKTLGWAVFGVEDPFEPVAAPLSVGITLDWVSAKTAIQKALRREKHFRRDARYEDQHGGVRIRHQLGWSFVLRSIHEHAAPETIQTLAHALDPLVADSPGPLLSDLHTHTSWSDGSASVTTMANAVIASGLSYFAVTDHSRSAKLQGGLTPLLWVRQANALTLATPVCPVLHGIEVDILKDGSLDLPQSVLKCADLVVASVHSSWTNDARTNTERLLRAIESGCVDIIAHPTSALVGKPGVPDYLRAAADLDWDEVFKTCSRWRVALELNCFPSRLDLPRKLLKKAVAAGCVISLGSDAHARSHLLNLRYGKAALRQLERSVVLNTFSYDELRAWVSESRAKRRDLEKGAPTYAQSALPFDSDNRGEAAKLIARIRRPQNVPTGTRIVGIDLTAGNKPTGMAILDGHHVETCSLSSDGEILAYISQQEPAIVSIDSPLGLPGGGRSIDPDSGIVRVAEYDLASIGIPAYPALIDSMRNLTLRGIGLRRLIEQLPCAPRVIESYPGAAQDILCIPRKQKSLDLLREGLRRLGLYGPGLETRSHDEMDAVTSAIVGRYFESGLFEPMGIREEAQLIVPKVRPFVFDCNPVICLSGKTGAGKSVVARYLSVFYGFEWIRTRNVIRQLLLDDIATPQSRRLFKRTIDPAAISEGDLREFGAVILDVYHQVPLRTKLMETIQRTDGPVVVDSIRDLVDLNFDDLNSRSAKIWFVDCKDSIIAKRLTSTTKLGEKRPHAQSLVDRTAPTIRRKANHVIINNGSLEELRWRVDDILFGSLELLS